MIKLALFAILAASVLSAQPYPTTVTTVGGGCDGNRQCSADFGIAAKIADSGTYSYSQVEFIPSLVPLVNGKTTLAVTPVITTQVLQAFPLSATNYITVSGGAGSSIPSNANPGFNFSTTERISLVHRLGKWDATTGAGKFVALTMYFTQIQGAAAGSNGLQNTIGIRAHFGWGR